MLANKLLAISLLLAIALLSVPIETLGQKRVTPCWQTGIGGAVSDFTCTKAKLGRYMLRDEALIIAQNMQKKFPNWTEYLPDCPLIAPQNDPMWEDASGVVNRIDCFHPRSVSCFRSTEGYLSRYRTEHCQQCCYDAQKRLIPSGQGAGTPDFRCSKFTIDSDHCYFDVMPWTALGWVEYNKFWTPNQGMFTVSSNRKYVETGVYVKKGEFIHFNADPRFRVVWGEYVRNDGGVLIPDSRLEAGPEGKVVDPASEVMNLLLTPDIPMTNDPYAALIGYVKKSDGTLTGPFFIGAESAIEFAEDGQLVLGINAPVVKDNEGSFAVSIRRCSKDDCQSLRN
jgi:hypothetical protein